MKETEVSLELRPGWTATMTVSEVRALAQRCLAAIRTAPKVKCPTCRCSVLAEEECMCCKYRGPDEEDPFC